MTVTLEDGKTFAVEGPGGAFEAATSRPPRPGRVGCQPVAGCAPRRARRRAVQPLARHVLGAVELRPLHARAVREELRTLFETDRPASDRIRIRMTWRIPELYASGEGDRG